MMRQTISTRCAGLAAATVLAALALTGCGTATVPLAPPATAPGQPAGPSGAATDGAAQPVVVDGRTIPLPPGFTFPADTTVSDVVGGVVTITAPRSSVALDYWRGALPRAGYTIEVDQSDILTWTGRGWAGTITGSGDRTDLTFGAVEPSATGSATVDDGPIAPGDLGLRHVPFFLRLPPHAQLSDVADRVSGASFTLTQPDPQTVLAFYRDNLVVGFFTITEDSTDGDVTTIRFTDDDGWTGVLVVDGRRATVQTTAP